MKPTPLIKDEQSLESAAYASGTSVSTYDDGFGPLWISRNSIGVNGIVRARTEQDAYNICEDEFFPEANESLEELIKEYGFKREHKKVVRDRYVTTSSPGLNVGERFEIYPDDYPNGSLAPAFIRWETVVTPDPSAWRENELFQEAYGFRPNGPKQGDVHNHGIYQKDLSGEDSLDLLTVKLLADLEITPVIKVWIKEEK